MRANKRLSAFLIVAGSFISGISGAQAPTAPSSEGTPPAVAGVTTTTAGYPDSQMRVGLNLVPMPVGSLKGEGVNVDMAFAFGVRAFFDYLITPNFFVGLAPTYTFNVIPKDAGANVDAGKQFDLLLRLGGGAPISDSLQLYGYLSPGYSIVMNTSDGEDPKGFVLGLNGGAMYTLNPKIFLNGEVGYQLGYQKVSVQGVSLDAGFRSMQVALGGGIRF